MYQQPQNNNNEKNFRLAFLLNLGFAIAEVIGGITINSMAILADALHDLGDSLTLLISWQLEKLSEKKEDLKFSYGYRRFSLLGALISAIVLIVGSIFVITEAFERFSSPQTTNARGMLAFAIAGIAINGYAAYKTSQGKNLNSQLIAWHLIEDVLGWLAVLVVSIVLLFTNIQILDPLLSLVVTGIVIYNVFKNLRQTLALFLQAVPDSVDISHFEEQIKRLKMVEAIHHTHIWSLDGENHVLTTHVVLCPGAKKEEIRVIKNTIKELASRLGVSHSTIELEYLEEDCSMSGTDQNQLQKIKR